jgi:hypothetical protein
MGQQVLILSSILSSKGGVVGAAWIQKPGDNTAGSSSSSPTSTVLQVKHQVLSKPLLYF